MGRLSKKVIQTVVRTYPYGFVDPLTNLKKYLNDGYTVVMCNNMKNGDKEVNDYILQKEVDE